MLLIRIIFFMIVEKILPGFQVENIWAAVIASIIYGVVSFLFRPILYILSIPINILTLGLFNFAITAALFMITAFLSSGVTIDSFGTAILGAIILSILQMLLENN